jgi:aminomethyltransferase
LGYEIYLCGGNPRHGAKLWRAMMAAGAKHGIAPGGPSAIRRIEGGLISYGADATIADNPFELGLSRLVDLDGGDFVGRAALQKIKAAGITRKLCGLLIDGEPLSAANNRFWECFSSLSDSADGEVRSAIYSPRLGKNIAIAMLSLSAAQSGAKITVAAPDGKREAQVCDLPFIPSRAKS